ncbi:hypothetical protein DPMN_090548 [Dreissena polymorpha]|uniref:Uncharacterized protein n=1 Tax=Dreissena polymorpha TaxID=45954 RepID=A0A9D4QYE9_DREPO|nr:hypothetical protein DPMN_090548 [Dreissena polymorpha]
MSCAGSTSKSREPETVAGCQVESVWPKRSTREPETMAGCQVELGKPKGSLSKSRESETVAGCWAESYETVHPRSSSWFSLEEFCRYSKEPDHAEFKIAPVNSVAGLLHWRVLYLLAALLKPIYRSYWIEQFSCPQTVAGQLDSYPWDHGGRAVLSVVFGAIGS